MNFIPIDYLYKIFPPAKHILPGARVEKKIKLRAIYNTKENNILPTDSKLLRETHCVPVNKFPFASEIDIYSENKIAIIDYKDKTVGVMIESKQLHDTFKIIFELAWEAAEKY